MFNFVPEGHVLAEPVGVVPWAVSWRPWVPRRFEVWEHSLLQACLRHCSWRTRKRPFQAHCVLWRRSTQKERRDRMPVHARSWAWTATRFYTHRSLVCWWFHRSTVSWAASWMWSSCTRFGACQRTRAFLGWGRHLSAKLINVFYYKVIFVIICIYFTLLCS